MNSEIKFRLVLFFFFLAGAVITVLSQFNYIAKNFDTEYIATVDLGRHQAKIDRTAEDPYRFRLLSDYALEGLLRVVPGALKDKYAQVSFGFRLIQNFFLFWAAYAYFKTLKLSRNLCLVGLSLISFAMGYAFPASDLSFYTYTEIILFLITGILVNRGWIWPVLPLTILAALNREEAVFIPFLLLSAPKFLDGLRVLGFKGVNHRYLLVFSLSLFVFFITYFGLRAWIGPGKYAISRYGEIFPGIILLKLNLKNPKVWMGLLQMYNLTVLAVLFLKKWPRSLLVLLVCVLLPWFAAQFYFASADETRLFLLPLVLVLIPAILSQVHLPSPEPSHQLEQSGGTTSN
jgi:hypothetical protein